jgi:hypothetical protein
MDHIMVIFDKNVNYFLKHIKHVGLSKYFLSSTIIQTQKRRIQR